MLFMIRIAEKIPKKSFESITDYEGLFAIQLSTLYRIVEIGFGKKVNLTIG